MTSDFEGGLFGGGQEVSFEAKIRKAVGTLRNYQELALEHDPESGYHLCFSGGKDSVVIKRLAEMAGVKFSPWYNVTGIDPPEIVKFIRQEHPTVRFRYADKPFFKTLVESKGVPTRKLRWCCAVYKEPGGEGKVKILGVRAAESVSRMKNWRTLTPWRRGEGGWCVCPILEWTDDDVWRFIRELGVKYCSLYDEGFKRLGCIGCPMAMDHRLEQFARWPKYELAWKRAIERYWINQNAKYKGKLNPRTGKTYFACRFSSAEELWSWWMSNDKAPDGCDMGMF